MSRIWEALLLVFISFSPIGEGDMHSLQKLQSLPVYASVYDPMECYDDEGEVIENINCDSDPRHVAAMIPVEEAYDLVIACPQYMFGYVLYFDGIGTRLCWDTGGNIKVQYREVYTSRYGYITTHFLVLDFLEQRPYPSWAYETFWPDQWEIILSD